MRKYCEISEKFTDDGIELECVEGEGCINCHYKALGCQRMLCHSSDRPDKVSVKFQPVQCSFKPFVDGQWAWSYFRGWGKISISRNGPLIFHRKQGYFPNGCRGLDDKYPTLLHEPPPHIHDPRPEEEFKKGEMVEVRDHPTSPWSRAYFCHKDGDRYYTFQGNKTEWASYGHTVGWKYCRKWEGD